MIPGTMPTTTDTPRVAFNLMSARLGGGLTYAISQTRAFLEIWPHDRIVILTAPWNDDALQQALHHPTLRLKTRSALHRYLTEQTLMLGSLRKEQVDVFYGIGNFLPLTPTRCRMIMTLQNPNYVGEGRLLPYASHAERLRRRLSYASMKRADLVITISASLDAALRSEEELKDVRTRVILSGAPDWASVASSPNPAGPIGGQPFILSVANDYPHKRLEDIARAFAISTAPANELLKLVLVGNIQAHRQEALRAAAGDAATNLIFLGSVAERGQIKWLYEHASAAVSASELEAFPLTPAEAACLRCPIILTDIPPHLEVAEGAGIYFQKGDIRSLANLITSIARDTTTNRAPPWNWPHSWTDNALNLADAIRGVAGAPSQLVRGSKCP